MSHAATLAAFTGAGPMAQAEAMSPHRQIELLLGGLLTRIARLRHAMRQPRPEARRDDADRALAILAYLRAVSIPRPTRNWSPSSTRCTAIARRAFWPPVWRRMRPCCTK